MRTIRTFADTFLNKLFCCDDGDSVLGFLSPNVCVVCLGTGKSAIGIDCAQKFLSASKTVFKNCTIADFQTTQPCPGLYCTVSKCLLSKEYDFVSTSATVSLTILMNGDIPSIIQICLDKLLCDTGSSSLSPDKKMKLKALTQNFEKSMEQLDIAIHHSFLNMWEYDIQKSCIYQNEPSMDIHGFGHIIEDVPHSLVESKYVHPDSAGEFLEMYRRLLSGEPKVSGTFQVMNADRTDYWWEKITYMTEYGPGHSPVKAIGFSTDVTEHMHIQQELKRVAVQKQTLSQNTLLSMVIDFTDDKILDADAREAYPITDTSLQTYSDLYNLLSDTIADGSKIDEIQSHLSKEDILKRFKEGKTSLRFDYLCRELSPSYTWAQFFLRLEMDPDNGHLIGKGYIEDIDRRKKHEIQMQKYAQLDDLTQIFNRMTFKTMTAAALKQLNRQALLAFGILDLDDFKYINDHYGHAYGDSVLKKIAIILKNSFRKDGFAGRLGGDEFVFVMTNLTDLVLLRNRLKHIFEELQTPDEIINRALTASIGTSIAPWDGDTFDELYKKADTALYCAKNGGKNKWCIYGENAD